MSGVYLTIPCYGGKVAAGAIASTLSASSRGLLKAIKSNSYSILTQNFNMLYCEALNARAQGITHFAMLHDDVTINTPLWLDKMMDLMEENEADILSVIIPIKSREGYTSTAFDMEGWSHWFPKKLTLTEAYEKFPATFTHEKLLLNTGLMLVDIRKDWAEKCYFLFENKIFKDAEGKFKAAVVSEDWAFSRMARELGARLFATREISVLHDGMSRWGNDKAWGSVAEAVDKT